MYTEVYDDIYVKALQQDCEASRGLIKWLFDLEEGSFQKYEVEPRQVISGNSTLVNDIALRGALLAKDGMHLENIVVEVQKSGSLEDIAWRVMRYAYVRKRYKDGDMDGVVPLSGIVMLRYRTQKDEELLHGGDIYSLRAKDSNGVYVVDFNIKVKFLSDDCSGTVLYPLFFALAKDKCSVREFALVVGDAVKKYPREIGKYVLDRFYQIFISTFNPTKEEISVYNTEVDRCYEFVNPFDKVREETRKVTREEVRKEYEEEISKYKNLVIAQEREYKEREKALKKEYEEREAAREIEQIKLMALGFRNLRDEFGRSEDEIIKVFEDGPRLKDSPKSSTKSTVGKLNLTGDKG